MERISSVLSHGGPARMASAFLDPDSRPAHCSERRISTTVCRSQLALITHATETQAFRAATDQQLMPALVIRLGWSVHHASRTRKSHSSMRSCPSTRTRSVWVCWPAGRPEATARKNGHQLSALRCARATASAHGRSACRPAPSTICGSLHAS